MFTALLEKDGAVNSSYKVVILMVCFFFFCVTKHGVQGSSLKGALFECCWFAGLEKKFPRLKAVVARFARASLPTTEWRGKG